MPLHPVNAYLSIFWILLGTDTFTSAVEYANAYSPIVVMLSGIFIPVREALL